MKLEMRDKQIQEALEVIVSEIQSQEELIGSQQNTIDRQDHDVGQLEATLADRDLRILMLEGKIKALEQALAESYLTSKERIDE